MNKPDVKKLVLLNLPYVFAFYFADKIAAVFRLAPGTEFIDKLTNGFAVFGSAFANPLPSFHPVDLLIGHPPQHIVLIEPLEQLGQLLSAPPHSTGGVLTCGDVVVIFVRG